MSRYFEEPNNRITGYLDSAPVATQIDPQDDPQDWERYLSVNDEPVERAEPRIEPAEAEPDTTQPRSVIGTGLILTIAFIAATFMFPIITGTIVGVLILFGGNYYLFKKHNCEFDLFYAAVAVILCYVFIPFLLVPICLGIWGALCLTVEGFKDLIRDVKAYRS